VGKVKIPFYIVIGGRGYWQPSGPMRRAGARATPCGPDGPDAWARAVEANDAWKAKRAAAAPPTARPMIPGTLAAAFAEYRRTPEWALKAPRTREDWDRCWARINLAFGSCRPRDVTLAQISGFRAIVEKNVSRREAHRCIKIWRALWKVAAALKYCSRDADPSLGVRNLSAAPRSAVWTDGEVARLVKGAWRSGYKGLAAAMAIAWDTSLSPVDIRGLSPKDRQGDAFRVARAKTGRAAIGTLGPRALRVLDAYLIELGASVAPASPLFRNRRGSAYSKDTLGDDFRDVRAIIFGAGETRTLADFRRSGTVEAIRGGATDGQIASKMANQFDKSSTLRRTYAPVDFAAVRAADKARKRGRK
jgi:hypothetical protein